MNAIRKSYFLHCQRWKCGIYIYMCIYISWQFISFLKRLSYRYCESAIWHSRENIRGVIATSERPGFFFKVTHRIIREPVSRECYCERINAMHRIWGIVCVISTDIMASRMSFVSDKKGTVSVKTKRSTFSIKKTRTRAR